MSKTKLGTIPGVKIDKTQPCPYCKGKLYLASPGCILKHR